MCLVIGTVGFIANRANNWYSGVVADIIFGKTFSTHILHLQITSPIVLLREFLH